MSREQARREIDSLDFYLQNHTDDYGEESHTAMMMAIEALSSSENPNKWIPCSERLPEENGSYFVTVKRGYVTTAIWVGTAKFWNEVTAWMSLPEPYQPEIPTVAEGSDKE